MHHSYTEINLDKSVNVRFKTIYKNNLTLHFKFYDKNEVAINVSGLSFRFTITDKGKTVELLVVQNSQWTRPSSNEIKHVINSLDIVPDTYKVDFTCTYADGRIQTLMDGEFIIRERYIL